MKSFLAQSHLLKHWRYQSVYCNQFYYQQFIEKDSLDISLPIFVTYELHHLNDL